MKKTWPAKPLMLTRDLRFSPSSWQPGLGASSLQPSCVPMQPLNTERTVSKLVSVTARTVSLPITTGGLSQLSGTPGTLVVALDVQNGSETKAPLTTIGFTHSSLSGASQGPQTPSSDARSAASVAPSMLRSVAHGHGPDASREPVKASVAVAERSTP